MSLDLLKNKPSSDYLEDKSLDFQIEKIFFTKNSCESGMEDTNYFGYKNYHVEQTTRQIKKNFDIRKVTRNYENSPKKHVAIRYDEPLKNIKSRAHKPYLLKIKSNEKGNPNLLSIELLIKYMRELFIVDTNKPKNKSKLNYTIKDNLLCTIQDIKLLIFAKEEKLRKFNLKSNLFPEDFEIRNKAIKLRKDLLILMEDLKKIEKNIDINHLERCFNNQVSRDILGITFIEIIENFKQSKDSKHYRKVLENRKGKCKEYLLHYDSILSNFEDYLDNKKIKFNFIGRRKKNR